MCLTEVDSELKVDSGVGYKVFRESDGEYYHECFPSRKPLFLGKTVKDEQGGVLASLPSNIMERSVFYPIGYHVFLDLDHANEWRVDLYVIVKVRFEDVVATGLHRLGLIDMPCVVCKTITLLEEVECV